MNDTLEAWLKDNAPEAWFAGYDVADSALIALNEYKQTMDRLRAQVARRDATIATLTERLSRCACTDDFGNVTG
jgi:hypothetical protein